MDGDREFELESSGEAFMTIPEALAGQDTYITNVNMPNVGQVADIESGAVVETNAVIRAGEVKPMSAGGFPRPLRSVIQGHVDTIETIVDAAEDGDLDRAFQGFLIDPQVRTLQTEEARAMFAELVEAERAYLDDWNLDDADVLES